MNPVDEQIHNEREADRPQWAAFWAAYRPLTPPAPPRRPSPAEIEHYLQTRGANVTTGDRL